MSKLLSLTMSADLGGLKAQEIDFNTNGDIVEVKGVVGSGKTTAQRAPELALSGGNSRMFDDPLTFGEFDNEVCIMASQKLYMRTYVDKNGNWKSVVHQKDANGKMSKDPIINGKKMTPAVARETFQTELTFGAGRFISQDPREHLKFMMDTYSWKLKEMGVIFDKSAPDYVNSILWRLDQAKLDRGQKEYHKKAVNGFKNHLEAEGWDEQNVPGLIDIVSINAQITILNNKKIAAENAHRESQFEAKQTEINRIQSEIDKLTSRGSELMGVVVAYNANISTQMELRRNELEKDIFGFNHILQEKIQHRVECISHLSNLQRLGYAGNEVSEWLESLPPNPEPRILETELSALPLLAKVPTDEKGKVSDFTPNYTDEINTALIELSGLREKLTPLYAQKANPTIETADFDPTPYNTEALTQQIESAKATNKISERWAAFHYHQEADEKVKEIWKEYCEMFTRIDLGVPGLSMAIVGDEEKSEIRTKYTGEYNPALFGNESGEPRLLNAYSETQKPVIAILMQKYLLDEKIKKGEDGLRAIFVEMPMDRATRLTLKQMKNEFDIDIFTSTTGDFEREGLENGQFIIENGILLSK